MKRIFSIRLNLDDMMASTEFLEGDSAFADWLRGFRVGSRGGPCRWDGGSPGADGYVIGANALSEAQGFQAKKSAGGKKSAKVRKEKHGTAYPRAQREDTSKTHRVVIKDTSNQTLIVNRVNSKGENEEPVIDPDEQNIFAPSSDPKTRPMIDRVRAIPGLQRLPKDMEALVASANAYGIENLTAAVDECNRSGQKAYENIVTPIAARMKHEQENPSSQYCKEGPSLPDNLNDLPIGHPLRIFLRKAQVAE